MEDKDTLCGWGNEEKVAYFLANADIIVPRRAEQLNLLLELLPYSTDAAISVLDLGAGFGAIAERVLRQYPKATVTCIDGSPAMVAHASSRLRNYGERVKILRADLSERSWTAVLHSRVRTMEVGRDTSELFNAVVSAIAIHHLTHERKRELCREVFKLLMPNGVFLNNDVVATPPAFTARFEELNLAAIQEQEGQLRGSARTREQIQAEMRERLRVAGDRHQSHIASLAAQLAWLTDAGFKSVDCYWRYLDLAIFGGVKEPSER
jgi:cyclopropane fatty-acyl-phospholipid synthase-like methyltransferase